MLLYLSDNVYLLQVVNRMSHNWFFKRKLICLLLKTSLYKKKWLIFDQLLWPLDRSERAIDALQSEPVGQESSHKEVALGSRLRGMIDTIAER